MSARVGFFVRWGFYTLLFVLAAAVGYLLFASRGLDDAAQTLVFWLSILILVVLGLVFAVALLMRAQTWQIRRAARENRQANQRLAATINASMDAVIVADMHGLILDYNGSAEKIFGHEKSEVLGLNLSEIIIPPHLRTAHKNGLKRYRETEAPRLVGNGTVAISAIRKDGTEFPVELLLQRGEAKEGPIMISYIRDMTEAKAAELALQEARDAALAADKAKSRFLAIMSHEMRTPLTGIFGALDLIGDTRLTKKQQAILDLALTSTKTLKRHVDDVLDISRIDSVQLDLHAEPVSLPQLCKELQQFHDPIARETRNRILITKDGLTNPFVTTDSHRLRQILVNLMTNALKFTHDGLVTLSVEEAETFQENSRYRFTVEDTGSGISQQDQPHIFEEFYTQDQSYSRTNQGTGLGLSIVARLVSLMGGSVDFTSTLGKGSRFWFDLVLPHAAEAPEEPLQIPEPQGSTRGRRVLLVEDNDTSRLVIAALLRKLDLEVMEAANGAEAVTTAHDHGLDLILMDISMPVMDGLEATRKIKQGDGPNKTTPILALTAHALPAEQEQFLAAGMEACLTKPVAPAELARTLRAYLPQDETAPASNAMLADLRTTLGPELFEKTLQSFLSETAEAFEMMATTVAAADWPSSQSMAHKTLGAAGLMGEEALSLALREVEQAAKREDAAAVPPAFKKAQNKWARVRQTLSLDAF